MVEQLSGYHVVVGALYDQDLDTLEPEDDLEDDPPEDLDEGDEPLEAQPAPQARKGASETIRELRARGGEVAGLRRRPPFFEQHVGLLAVGLGARGCRRQQTDAREGARQHDGRDRRERRPDTHHR